MGCVVVGGEGGGAVFSSLAVLVIRQGGRGGVCAVVAGCLVGVEFAVSCVCEVGEGRGEGGSAFK